MGKLVLFLLRLEAQLVDQFQGVAQRIAALEAVSNLAEDFADLVFDGVRAAGPLPEPLQIRKKLPVHVVDQVVAGQRVVMVERTVGLLRGRPFRPSVLVGDDARVGLADKLGLHRPALFQVVQVFEEQYPRCLLCIIQLRRAAGLFPQDVVDILEGLLEHASSVTPGFSGQERRWSGFLLRGGKNGRNGYGIGLGGGVRACGEADRSSAPAPLGDRFVLDQRGVDSPIGIVPPS